MWCCAVPFCLFFQLLYPSIQRVVGTLTGDAISKIARKMMMIPHSVDGDPTRGIYTTFRWSLVWLYVAQWLYIIKIQTTLLLIWQRVHNTWVLDVVYKEAQSFRIRFCFGKSNSSSVVEFLVELTWILFFFDVIMTSLRRCWNDRRSFHIKKWSETRSAASRLLAVSAIPQRHEYGWYV